MGLYVVIHDGNTEKDLLQMLRVSDGSFVKSFKMDSEYSCGISFRCNLASECVLIGMRPWSMALDFEQNLFVCDNGNGSQSGSIEQFDLESGAHAKTICRELDYPRHVVVEPSGTLIIADNHKVSQSA